MIRKLITTDIKRYELVFTATFLGFVPRAWCVAHTGTENGKDVHTKARVTLPYRTLNHV